MPVDAAIPGRATRLFGSRARGDFDVTVVVPTRNERHNVALLLRRLESIRPDLRLEVDAASASAGGADTGIGRSERFIGGSPHLR